MQVWTFLFLILLKLITGELCRRFSIRRARRTKNSVWHGWRAIGALTHNKIIIQIFFCKKVPKTKIKINNVIYGDRIRSSHFPFVIVRATRKRRRKRRRWKKLLFKIQFGVGLGIYFLCYFVILLTLLCLNIIVYSTKAKTGSEDSRACCTVSLANFNKIIFIGLDLKWKK